MTAIKINADVKATTLSVLALIGFLASWEITAYFVASPFFPTVGAVFKAFKNLIINGDTQGISLATHSWASLYRVLLGFNLGVLLGVPIGLLMGLNKQIYNSTRSVVEPFRFIPPIAWIPLAIIFFAGDTRFAFLIFLGAFLSLKIPLE